MATTVEVVCYVDACSDLVTIDTAETLRRASRDERKESAAEGTGTGAIGVQVPARTVARRAPRLAAWLRSRGQM